MRPFPCQIVTSFRCNIYFWIAFNDKSCNQLMNKYIFLILFFLFGFTLNDIRKEIIIIDWYESEMPENGLGLSFLNAEYPDGIYGVPVYYMSIPASSDENDIQFVLENPLFEEINPEKKLSFDDNIPEAIELKKTSVKSGRSWFIQVQIPVIIKRENKRLLLKKFEIKQIPVRIKSSAVTLNTWKNESVLKSGNWHKISTAGKGIYKIPYSKLTEWGFSDPSRVSIYGAGGLNLTESVGNVEFDDLPQIGVWHGKNKGTDCIFFYDPGTTGWQPDSDGNLFHHKLNAYSNVGYFFLNENSGTTKNIVETDEITDPPSHLISSFDEYQLIKSEKFNLLNSGKKWFGDIFINGTTRNYSFEVNDPALDSDIFLRINAAARSSAPSEMVVSTNQVSLGKINFSMVNTSDVTAVYADERETLFEMPVADEEVSLILKYFGRTANPEAWIDFIEINYRRKLKHDKEKVLFFRDIPSVGDGNILQFTIESVSSAIKVWDVTDMFNIKEIPVKKEGGKFTGKNNASVLREYAVFDPEGTYPEPNTAGKVDNQNLHALITPDFLIISHPEFMVSADELASFHRTYDGLNVEVVQSDKVYNEFSSGRKEAVGIRNFIKMFYDRGERLKYVLLFGDGSYDNKNIRQSNKNFIPTFQSDNSLNPLASFVSDDYFVILDKDETVYNGAVDLGIGRLPVSARYEAELVVDKIKSYNTPEALGNWRNSICFIADDEDGNLHMYDSERLADLVNQNHGEFLTDKIYFDAYKQITGPGGERYPGVTTAINDKVKNGVLILNYVGHANDRFIADENVLDVSHINSWSNAGKLPIFVTATCEFSRFDNDETSAGEYVLLNRNGGGIGLFSTSRLAFAVSNYFISRSFYSFVFQKDENGENYRMGDIMRLTKANTINSINKRNFILLADPALRLSYPQYSVNTTSVNGVSASEQADTLGALQKVTVTGYIADNQDRKQNTFNGEIALNVYDKELKIKTLGNAGETPFEFKVRENIIYKGLSEVKDGVFTFSFVIPKDISYSVGEGKIVYYADNGETDAHGVFTNFFIGGKRTQVTDNTPPEIELYIDTPEFVSGDKVNKNCTLLAFLTDDNGINTVGTGIGHDITAILDNDPSSVMLLNDYYIADKDNYSRGTIRFPLRDLVTGIHSLKVKAWDVANNSTESEIEFEVVDNFRILNVANYPNPVSDYTYFSFEHNEPDASFDAIFEIFDPGGSRLDYFQTWVGSAGNVSNPVRWETGSLSKRLRSGVYIYKITIRNKDGLITSGAGKMVFFR